MKNIMKFLLLLGALALTGCGGGSKSGGGQNNKNDVLISIYPVSAKAAGGTKVLLTVTTKNTNIIWPTLAAGAGSYTKNGNQAEWTLPLKTGTYEFTVTAAADSAKRATARIEVFLPEPEISVYPASMTLDIGSTAYFIAELFIPNGQPDQTADWKIAGNCGTISQQGVFHAQKIGNCSLTVSIKGNAVEKITATAAIKVQAPPEYAEITQPGAENTYLIGINDSGVILGVSHLGGNARGFVKEGAAYTTVEYPGAINTYVQGINNANVVVGSYEYEKTWFRGFQKTASGYTDIEYPGSADTNVTGINNSGVVVGYYWDAAREQFRGFKKTGATYEAFDCSGALATYPLGINDNGTIVGSFKDSDGWYHGFEKTGAVCVAVDYSPITTTEISGINNAGATVGYFTDSDGLVSGFVKTGENYRIVRYPDAEETQVMDINNAGRIVGYYIDTDGRYHGFVE